MDNISSSTMTNNFIRASLNNSIKESSLSQSNIANNNHVRIIKVNQILQPSKTSNNKISTSKYNVLTFLPIFLFEQFQKYSNIFFLIIVLFQQIPGVSPTGRYTTLVPLIFILGVSAIKEIIEDFKRRKSDHMINNKNVIVYKSNSLIGSFWKNCRWKDINVGDIIKITTGELFPADILLLSSSEPNSICYIQTSNLDGETNYKIRQGLTKTSHLIDSNQLQDFRAEIECELPNHHLYEFTGNLIIKSEKIPLGPDQILLRGSMLQNTKWIYGVVIYTGHETKIMMNSTIPPFKRSQVEKMANKQTLLLLALLLLICFISTIASEIWVHINGKKHWYLAFDELKPSGIAYTFLTFIILYNNLIPISLQVTLELVKFLQAYFINLDDEMFDSETGFSAVARTSNLNEELGQVKYVFSDKTGTLTCNKMEFKRCTIAGIQYGSGNENEFNSYQLLNNLENHPTRDIINEFLTLISTCHTVIPEKKENNNQEIEYQASSPDEGALVKAINKMGIIFHTREPEKIRVKFLNEEREYQILNVLEFNSIRKRMSVIVRDRNGIIKLYCKGADSVIIPRLSLQGIDYKDYTDNIIDHMEQFAKEGFRTLVLAYKIISEEDYQKWNRDFNKAATSIENRENKIEEIAEKIEKNLIILGATAIEDKLQQDVPETINMLIKAGIKIWVLTGDKIETAINIGYSCKLLEEDTFLINLVEDRIDKLKEQLRFHCCNLSHRYKSSKIGLIVDGKALQLVFSLECKKEFLELALSSKTVICCRATPKNKAQVVGLIKKATNSVTLAIGDGANDVSMIQVKKSFNTLKLKIIIIKHLLKIFICNLLAAHVGIGIFGREGTQALSASDYAIGQFRFLAKLLLVHGMWNYKRLCKVILYSFYKNICLYIIELWFGFSNGFSGQILFERWLIGLYNVLFTAAPPMALGLFDRPSKISTMIKFPELYKIPQNNFDFKVFWTWIFNSFLHSIILYFVCLGIFKSEILNYDGSIGDYLFMGNHVYTYCVIIVCLKSGLETDSWTWITHLSIWGSMLFWFIFLIFYSHLWELIGVAPEMTGMASNLYREPIFWLGIFFVPIFVLLPDVVYKSLQRTLYKTNIQVIQENEIKNQEGVNLIQKSRLTETAKLLKSAFSFTRVPPIALQTTPYRGFAFSQEENGAVAQADLIRFYNTSLEKPSGN